MGTTNPDALPYPDDYSDPADTPAALEALALAAQAALTRDRATVTAHNHDGRYSTPHAHPYAADTHNHDGRYAWPHDHPYAAAGHGHDPGAIGAAYAGHGHDPGAIGAAYAGHGHNPSASGIGVVHHNFGSLSAGQTKSQVFARSNDQYPVVCVNHPSTYILAVVSSLDNGTYTIEVRNSTSSTTHTNVHVIVHLVRAA